MSLAEGVLQIIEYASKSGFFARVKTVWLEIGALSGVETEAMRFCFDAVTRGSVAEGAVLEIVAVPGTAWCMQCGATVPVAERYDQLRRLPAAGAGRHGDAGERTGSRVIGGSNVHGMRLRPGRNEDRGRPRARASPRRRHGAQPCPPPRRRARPHAFPWRAAGAGRLQLRAAAPPSRPRTCPRAGPRAGPHGADRAGHPRQEQRVRQRQPQAMEGARPLRHQPRLQPRLGQDHAAGGIHQALGRPPSAGGDRGRPADQQRRRAHPRHRGAGHLW